MKINKRQAVLVIFGLLVMVSVIFSWKSTIATAVRNGKRVNCIVLGTDWVDYSQHSDTIIFLSYQPKNRFLDIISIPRDTMVFFPDIKVNRINQVYAYYYKSRKSHDDAANGFMKVVGNLLENRVEVTHYLQVDYDAFRDFIDIIGKVKVEIEDRMDYDDNAGKLHIHFSTGAHILDGKQALEYVRFRGNAGDIGRIYRQQRFVKAVVRRVSNPLFVFKIPKLTKLVLEKLHTNLSFWDMLNLMIEAKNIKLENVRMAQLPGRPHGFLWEPNARELDHAINTIVGPEITVDKKEIPTVEVLNASSHDGAALDVTRKLRDYGFDVIDYRNYATRQEKTIIIDRVGNLRAAQKIAQALGSDEIFTRYDIERMVDISVIIGEDYNK